MAAPVTTAGGSRRRGILRRYATVLLAVVGGAVLVSNGVALLITYRGTQSRYDRVERQRVDQRQHDAMAPLARLMRDGLREFANELRAADVPGVARPTPAERAGAYAAATTGPASTFADIAYISPSGRTLVDAAGGQVRVPGPVSPDARRVLDRVRVRGSALGDAVAVGNDGTRALRVDFAVRAAHRSGGVVLSRLNLDFIPLLIGSFPRSSEDVVYLVDGRGHLVGRSDAPDDASLADVSQLPEVSAALAAGMRAHRPDDQAMPGRDLAGHRVLASVTPLPLQRWYLIALRPDARTQGPLTSAIVWIGFSLVVFLGLAALASVLLARRMTRPIRAMQAGAAAMGEGRLEDRIDVRTGDELETLADAFNGMAARLQESHATLEQRVEDRTRDLVEALDRLKRASVEKTRFLAHMSHELRTPLNAIINFADVLRDGSAGPLTSRQKAYADDVHGAGQHLLALITDLLDVAKIEAGRIDIETHPVALEALLREAARLVSPQAAARHVAVSVAVAPEAGSIEADGRKLRQVVVNLLANAIRFSEPGGTVDVHASRDDDAVRIAVADTGVGIDPTDRERVFEEYEQAGPPASRRGGTGLGLALARRLVELHGGRITLESAPGVGSTFTVELPALAGAPLPGPSPSAAGAP